MSLLRHDVTTNDWVVFAPDRCQRPHSGRRAADQDVLPNGEKPLCPFCPGNERLTPHEIYAVRDGAPPGWRVRVIPNKFPALCIEAQDHRIEEGPLFLAMGACGAHEVVIESPRHDLFLGLQPVEQIECVLRTLQFRFNDLMRDHRFRAITLFKNHGEGAGTSLRHPHWQLIATPVVPHLLRLKHGVATDYFDQTGHCLYMALLEDELADERRVLAVNEQFAAILPYASHVPFETWILPRSQQSSFGLVEPGRFRPLAEMLKTVLLKLYVGLENPDFNLTIDTVPRGSEDTESFLWHVQVLPRLAIPAGFELGSGMSINIVMPEDAASYLREVKTS